MTGEQPRRRLLAVHPGALGDLVLFGRLIEQLSPPQPGGGRSAPVTLVAGGEKAHLLAACGIADRAMDFDSLPIHEIFAEGPLDRGRLVQCLGDHETLVSCFPGDAPRPQQRLARACGASSAAFLPVRPPAAFPGHLLDFWGKLLDLPARMQFSAWPIPPRTAATAREELAKAGVSPGRPYVAIHPGAGAEDKRWPLENFFALGDSLPAAAALHDCRPVFLLGPAERERWPGEALAAVRRRFPAMCCPNLETLAGVLTQAAAFVGNDSGASHLAAAVGCPTVALFGPTSSDHFAPRGPRVRTIQRNDLCKLSMPDVAEAFRALLFSSS